MEKLAFIQFAMELLGTVAFAASGAMAGVKRHMDIFGVCVLGIMTAVGGGMIRDVILGLTPPGVFSHPVYVLVATVVSILIFLIVYGKRDLMQGHFPAFYDQAMLIMDTLGLGIFTVIGVNTGIQQGYGENIFLLVFLGTITGVGGGLIRDIMAGVPPYIFVKHIYACASIVGAVVCAELSGRYGEGLAMVFSCLVVILIRYLAARFHWNLPRMDF